MNLPECDSLPPELQRSIFEASSHLSTSRGASKNGSSRFYIAQLHWSPTEHTPMAATVRDPWTDIPTSTPKHCCRRYARDQSFCVRLFAIFTSMGSPGTTILPVCTGVKNLRIMKGAVLDDPPAEGKPLKPRGLRCLSAELAPLKLLVSDYASRPRQPDPVQDASLSFYAEKQIPLCLHLLQTCRTLAVIVLVRSAQARDHAAPPDVPVQDVRFVVSYKTYIALTDSQMAVHAGEDYWTRAERHIARPRAGEIDAVCYEVAEEPILEGDIFQTLRVLRWEMPRV
ncbi:hypothetical protein DFH07DRAFT_1060660 [Mycena maculata]|uniref:Uncharacterized protein n=1 Tax=Mycena maculata TaxID=230809 RepID=A0AAD7J964_9AGAR|nr:hypothetical protein DFH07DRAFT_1060660 [Mycena maculata]